ncbi:MAG: hypothetical protein GWN55_17315 [Phycisphaerae bacterium]|nr:hypothetical protein [candidate division Zixibacteria bacterium]NIS54753.1 hypothetical protein [Phycisphaerae bacterium]NIV03050.1 hypothetical protein [Phycisphaerae bacterium]NIW96547.1 hypothetical protein [Phycisphaerae bacterium]
MRFVVIRGINANEDATFGCFKLKNFFFVGVHDIPCALVVGRVEQLIE